MSDPHPTKDRSSEATARPETQTPRDEIDAVKAPSCSDYHHNQTSLTRRDARHWQGACQLIDCKLGASSCCRSWRNSLEETLSRSKLSAVALRRHKSVAMLPHLLSNLAVTRTRSEPCIFGKDFLRITLPLPGEPNCEANASSADHPESITSKNLLSCDAVRSLIGSETQGPSSSASVFTSHTSARQACDKIMTVTDLSSRSPCLWDGDESLDDEIAGPIPDIIEVLNVEVSSASLKKPREDFLGAESSTLELEQGWNVGKSSSCSPGSQVVASRTSRWDDWWTCHLEEFSVANGETEQHRDKSKGKGCTPAMVDDVDEDASDDLDEGYLVLDDQEDEKPGRCSENHDTGDWGNLEHVQNDAHDCANEESPTDWQSGNLKGYKEDDIWSDEHFVSSQAKGFPPPISILAHETHPGLPSHVPKTLWRSVKRNGRFVLQEVQARPCEFFQATREYGRLRLQLVRPDSDSTGSYTETASMEGSFISSESVGNFARISEVCQGEDSEIETLGAGSRTSLVVKSSTQGFNTSQVEDEEVRGDDDCVSSSPGLASPILSDEHGSTLQQEHSGADFGQRVKVVLGRRTSADAVLEECTDQMDSDVVVEGSRVAHHNIMIEETPGERVYDEGFGLLSSDIMAQELRELGVRNQANGMPPGCEEHYRQDYHPRFSVTYGFDNNLNVLSPGQTLMQLPIQSAVR